MAAYSFGTITTIGVLMIENRTAPRTRHLLRGKIIFNNKLSCIDCVIRDLTSGGAKLSVSQHVTIPEKFELEIPLWNRTHHAQLRWRSEDEIGVMFRSGDLSTGDAIDELKARVEYLETELATLHALIEKLVGRREPH